MLRPIPLTARLWVRLRLCIVAVGYTTAGPSVKPWLVRLLTPMTPAPSSVFPVAVPSTPPTIPASTSIWRTLADDPWSSLRFALLFYVEQHRPQQIARPGSARGLTRLG